jgi:hypothetical protein
LELPKWNDYFLMLESRMYPKLPNMGCEGVIYAPGLVCTYCGTSLKLGFVVRNDIQQNICGSECLQNCDVSKWRSVVKRARYFLLLDHFQQNEELKPADRKIFRGLSLLVQVLTWSDFSRAMFSKMLKGQSLSQKQIEVVEKMVTEHGGLEKLLRQRDLMRRLSLLYLSQSYKCMNAEDSQKVESLLLQSSRRPLTIPQERLIYALEDSHQAARNQLTRSVLAQWPFYYGKMIWD